jgi:competence protein ComEA
MKSTNTDIAFFPVKLLAFLGMLALAPLGLAQVDTATTTDPVAIEAEQIDINHADAETIARVLVGIGMSRAEAIVAYREEFGSFASLEELMMVRGVGEVTLKNNQSRIRFE